MTTKKKIDYNQLDGPALLEYCGDSGHRWAEAFLETCPDRSDLDLVRAWFANAIETAHDKRTGNGPVVLPDGSAVFVGVVDDI